MQAAPGTGGIVTKEACRDVFKALFRVAKGTMLHPQWLSDRYHMSSRKSFRNFQDAIILDIGSGNSDHFKALNPSCMFYRLDYPSTNKCYSVLPDIFGDARSLPVTSESIDVIFCFEVLEHVSGYERAIVEISRVLKPGGQFHLSVPFVYPLHDVPCDYQRFTIFGLRLLLETHGFTISREVFHGNSFVTAIQLFNLALLEAVRNVLIKNLFLGSALGMAVYPICLLANIIAWPLTGIRGVNASCFGYLLVAQRR